MRRLTIKERTAVLRAIPPMRALVLRSTPVRTTTIDGRGRAVVAHVSVPSLATLCADRAVVEALDVQGDWLPARRSGPRIDLTAELMGDPPFVRSALFERGR